MYPLPGKQGVSSQLLVRAFNEGLSGNATLNLLREQGYSIRTQTFYDQWRGAAGYAKGEWLASRQPEDRVPRDRFFSPGSPNQYEKYQYTFTADVTNPATGEREPGVLSVGSAERLTIAAAREQLTEGLTTRKEANSYGAELRSFLGVWERSES